MMTTNVAHIKYISINNNSEMIRTNGACLQSNKNPKQKKKLHCDNRTIMECLSVNKK